jgi:hypothetical protein
MLTSATLVERLITGGIAGRSEICGCSGSDIRIVQDTVKLRLPGAYIDFLAAIGRGGGAFLRDHEIYFPQMLHLNAKARELLDDCEEGRLLLPDRAFVFFMRYGEQFLFFIADGQSDNPPVLHYMENAGCFRQAATSFWDAIESELRISEDLGRDLPDSHLLK